MRKVSRRTLDNGTPVHSLSTLMAQMSAIVRNACRTPGAAPDALTFEVVTTPDAQRRHALELIGQLRL